MKKISTVALLLLLFGACNKDNPMESKLKNCKIEYLYFNDDITLADSELFGISAEQSNYSYSSGRLTRVDGGFLMFPSGNDLTNMVFIAEVYDSLVYNDNVVSLFKKCSLADCNIYPVVNPAVFHFDEAGNLVKINRKTSFRPNGINFFYTYEGNQILETNELGTSERIFYIEGGNLVKVTIEDKNNSGVLVGATETIFSGFDKHRNPFKKLFYVRGAFYRAFSENNFNTITHKVFSVNEQGRTLLSEKSFSISFGYNAQGWPKFGDY